MLKIVFIIHLSRSRRLFRINPNLNENEFWNNFQPTEYHKMPTIKGALVITLQIIGLIKRAPICPDPLRKTYFRCPLLYIRKIQERNNWILCGIVEIRLYIR